MSKLNLPAQPISISKTAASRREQLGTSANGNIQFVKSPLQMLYEVVVQLMVGKPGQLRTESQMLAMIKNHVQQAVEHRQYDFIANLAIHARTTMNVRTAPIVLVVEFAKALSDQRLPLARRRTELLHQLSGGMSVHANVEIVKQLHRELHDLEATIAERTYPKMRALVCDVIRRPDQITDLYAYALQVFGGKNQVPLAVRRGVADAFNKFNEYGFAKYNGGSGALKLRDVMRIVHPVSTSVEQGELFSRIMTDELATPYTWETELSKNGQLSKAEQKTPTQLWTELVSSGKVGYMALMRNLRNIHTSSLPKEVLREHVYNVIADPTHVAKSKQLPYDFKEAYNAVHHLDPLMGRALSTAMDYSVSNIPAMGERVWIIVDFSGSMGGDGVETSAFSQATYLAAVLLRANHGTHKLAVTLFGTSALTLKDIDTSRSIVDLQSELQSYRRGSIAGSTEFHAALAQRDRLGFTPDTIIVLTDGEVNKFPYQVIRNIAGSNVLKLTVNLSAALTTPMSTHDGWFTMAGWDPAMFEWVPAMRESRTVVDMLSQPYKGVNKVNE